MNRAILKVISISIIHNRMAGSRNDLPNSGLDEYDVKPRAIQN